MKECKLDKKELQKNKTMNCRKVIWKYKNYKCNYKKKN